MYTSNLPISKKKATSLFEGNYLTIKKPIIENLPKQPILNAMCKPRMDVVKNSDQIYDNFSFKANLQKREAEEAVSQRLHDLA